MKLATAAKKNPTVLSIVVIRTAKNVEGNDVERGRNRKKILSWSCFIKGQLHYTKNSEYRVSSKRSESESEAKTLMLLIC